MYSLSVKSSLCALNTTPEKCQFILIWIKNKRFLSDLQQESELSGESINLQLRYSSLYSLPLSLSLSAQMLWSNLHVIRDPDMTDSRTCNRSARNCWMEIREETRIIPILSLCSSLGVFWVIKLSCIPFTQMRLVICNDLTFHFIYFFIKSTTVRI